MNCFSLTVLCKSNQFPNKGKNYWIKSIHLLHSTTKLKVTRRLSYQQNKCIFSNQRNCPRKRSGCRFCLERVPQSLFRRSKSPISPTCMYIHDFNSHRTEKWAQSNLKRKNELKKTFTKMLCAVTFWTSPVLGSSNRIFLSLQVVTSLLPSQFHDALSGMSGRLISVIASAVPTFQMNILLSEPDTQVQQHFRCLACS